MMSRVFWMYRFCAWLKNNSNSVGFRETSYGTCTSPSLSTFLESTLKQLDCVREWVFLWVRLDFLFILEKYLFFLGEHKLLSLWRLFDKSLSMAWLPYHFLMLLGEWCFSAAWHLQTFAVFFPGNYGLQFKTLFKKSEVALVLVGVSIYIYLHIFLYIYTANCFITL